MTILSHLQEEGGDNYGYTSDSANPVATSAEFILKVSTNGTFNQWGHDTIELSECRSRSNQR